VDPKQSIAALTRLFRAAGAPDPAALTGDHRGELAGPAWLRLPAPLSLQLTGMAGWCGKSFQPPTPDGLIEGWNLVRRADGTHPSIPVQVRIAPSRLDGNPAFVVTYPATARRPWPHVTDELRPLTPTTHLGLTFGFPATPSSGTAFLLHRD
jgi:hypothetical protein